MHGLGLYSKCEGGDICCSPFANKQMDIEDDEGACG